jgi:sulfoxide reductase heme-binding subunit YedZ
MRLAAISLPVLSDLLPWRDRLGRLSPTRAVAFALALGPALWLAIRALGPGLGPEPVEVALHETGHWAVRLLLLSLAVSPVRRLWGWTAVMGVRRMLGLAAFFYAAAHLGLYAADQDWRWLHVGREMMLRIYLTIGFAALLGLTALAATSFDRAIRRLGPMRWRQLHRLVYLLAPLALAHFWMQVRLQDYVEPLVASGLLGWLFALRLAGGGAARGLLLALAAAVLTALVEAAFLYAWFGAPPMQVLGGNASTGLGLRPAWLVALISVPIALLPPLRDTGRHLLRRDPA